MRILSVKTSLLDAYMNLHAYRDDRFRDLRCMSFAQKGNNEILVAGCQDTMFKINVEKGTVSQAVCMIAHEMHKTIIMICDRY